MELHDANEDPIGFWRGSVWFDGGVYDGGETIYDNYSDTGDEDRVGEEIPEWDGTLPKGQICEWDGSLVGTKIDCSADAVVGIGIVKGKDKVEPTIHYCCGQHAADFVSVKAFTKQFFEACDALLPVTQVHPTGVSVSLINEGLNWGALVVGDVGRLLRKETTIKDLVIIQHAGQAEYCVGEGWFEWAIEQLTTLSATYPEEERPRLREECGSCRADLPLLAKFCSECGTKIE